MKLCPILPRSGIVISSSKIISCHCMWNKFKQIPCAKLSLLVVMEFDFPMQSWFIGMKLCPVLLRSGIVISSSKIISCLCMWNKFKQIPCAKLSLLVVMEFDFPMQSWDEICPSWTG